VDATSALFTYLLYLDQRLSSSSASRIDSRRTAGPHWISLPRANLAADDLSQSSWLQSEKTKQWTLFEEEYSADQGRTCIWACMQAKLLYQDVHYEPCGRTPEGEDTRYAVCLRQGRYGASAAIPMARVTSADDGISAAFSQG